MLFVLAEEARATIYHSQCAYMLSIQTKAVKNNNNKKPSLALYVIIMTFKAPYSSWVFLCVDNKDDTCENILSYKVFCHFSCFLNYCVYRRNKTHKAYLK